MSKADGEAKNVSLVDVVEEIKNVYEIVDVLHDELINVSETVISVKFEMLLCKRKREMIELFEDAAEEHVKARAKCVKMAAELKEKGVVDISELPIDIKMSLHDRFLMCGYGQTQDGCGKCKETLFATPQLYLEHKKSAEEK